MNLWISTPLSPSVDHPPVVPLGLNNISISVQADGDPIAGALVCAMQEDTVIYVVDTTDTNGIANLTFMVNYSDTIYLTVTGHTIYPYEGFILVNTTGAYISYLRSIIDDSAGGNNNLRVNPGETITSPVWVQNWGTDTAFNVSGNLRTQDIYVSIIDTETEYGSLCPGDSAISSPSFRFYIDTCCPGYHNVVFELHCTDSNNNWLSQFSVPVYAPIIVFMHDSIIGGNGNNLLEPGETVDFLVELKNEGNERAESVMTVLRGLNSYITISDSVSNYGDIFPDSTGNNSSDPCIITASDSTPIGTIADFQLEIRSGVYIDTILLSLIIGKKDYLVWNPDPTPSSGLNISNILSSLGYSGDYSTVLPGNISMYRAVFVCAGIWPNNFVLSIYDPKTTALVDYLTAGGRVYLEGGDVWYYDPLYLDGYNLNALFGINALEDGYGDMGPVGGFNGKFTQGMSFQYAGENYYMDHIFSSSNFILQDENNDYYCGVAFSDANYRTIGTSFELGNLVDSAGVSTRAALLDSIMQYFEVLHVIEESHAFTSNTSSYKLAVYPNPFRENAVIRVQVPLMRSENKRPLATLKIYDICGRCVKNFDLSYSKVCMSAINWDGKDNIGRKLSQGVYFVKLTSENKSLIEKVILLR